MIGPLTKEHTRRLATQVMVQIVPPTILASFAANELSAVTNLSFAEAAGIISAGILICVMINEVRV